MTTLAPEPSRAANDHGEDLDHVVCCDDDIALCGADVSGHDWGEGTFDQTHMCVVCRELYGKPCPRCRE